MEVLNIKDLEKEIKKYDPQIKPILTAKEKARWKELQELNWSKIFVDFLKTKFNIQYELIGKNLELEGEGEDVFLQSKNKNLSNIHIQLTHANEYDMEPTNKIKDVNVSGNCIIGAAVGKCSHYCENRINTEEIILLIQGIDESTKIKDLSEEASFLKIFKSIPCFKGIYYITPNQVYPLKEAVFTNIIKS